MPPGKLNPFMVAYPGGIHVNEWVMGDVYGIRDVAEKLANFDANLPVMLPLAPI